jgi:hypothetical protein
MYSQLETTEGDEVAGWVGGQKDGGGRESIK